MKNKIYTTIYAFAFLVITSFGSLSCTKNVIVAPETQANNGVQNVATSILEDSLFTNLVRDFMNESIILNANANDTSVIRISNERIASSLINFVTKQTAYSNLNSVERNMVLKYIIDSTKSQSYLLNNPVIMANLNDLKIMNKASLIKSNSFNGTPIGLKLTNDEIISCFLDTAINALGFYGEALADITGMAKSGASNSTIIRVGLNILKNASPWWKVGAIVLQFTNCIYQGI